MTTIHRSAALLLLLLVPGCHEAARRTLSVEEVSADEVRGWRGRPLVIDLRDSQSYQAGHLPGALSLRMDQLAGFLHRARPPIDRGIVVVCYHGNQSLAGAATVGSHGPWEVRSLRGGMEAWSARGYPLEKGPGTSVDAKLLQPPDAHASLVEQLVYVLSGFGFKSLYMLLNLVLVALLWRARDSDLRLLRRGLAAFFIGELICLLNFLFFHDSDALDLVHGVGMVIFGALLPWSFFRMLDDRVLHLSDPEGRCVVQRFCGHCWKHEPVSCGVQRLFLFMAPALALCALIPWSAPIHRVDLTMRILGTDVHWFKGVEAQIIEFRVYPALGALLLLGTMVQLLRGKKALQHAQAPFFAGLGFLSYSLLRSILFAFCQRMPVWADFWEELTELMTVLGVAVILWVFRGPLGLRRAKEA
jgi:rhodanese-related sulfurtransferase